MKNNFKKSFGRVLMILPVMLMTTSVYAKSCTRQVRIVYSNTGTIGTQTQTNYDITKYIQNYIKNQTSKTTSQQIHIQNTTTSKTTEAIPKTTSAPKPAAVTTTKTTTTEKPTEATTQAPKTNSSSPNQAIANEILSLVNKERAANGLSALTLDSSLSKVAQAKAQDMYNKGYFSHTSPTYGSPFDMMKSFGISYRTAGENIAKGQKTPAAVMNAWMNSDGHRKNILSSGYTRLGVGYVNAGGTTYWVQMFIG